MLSSLVLLRKMTLIAVAPSRAMLLPVDRFCGRRSGPARERWNDGGHVPVPGVGGRSRDDRRAKAAGLTQ